MAVARVQITFDCAEPLTLARFWAAVLGYPAPDVEGTHAVLRALGQSEDELGNWYRIEDSSGAGPNLAFQRVPEAKVVKNRVHLDVKPLDSAPDALETELARVVALGAKELRRVTDESGAFVVLADPEANEFCIG
jgi:Glyoxalase-like domain